MLLGAKQGGDLGSCHALSSRSVSWGGAGAAACRVEGGDGPKADRGIHTDSLEGAGKSVALRGYSIGQPRGGGR